MTLVAFNKRLDDLRTVLMMEGSLTYFAQILLRCKIVADDTISTAAIDGITVRINSEWFMALEGSNVKAQFSHQLFVLFHEALHPALHDLSRKGNRDHEVWNQAVDYFNNLYIDEKIQKIKYPHGNGYLLNTKYSGMDKEAIYDDLIKNPPPNSCPLASDMGDGDSEETIAEIEGIIQQAAVAAEQLGASHSIPDSVKARLDDLYKPKLNWRQILSRYMDGLLAREDYTYAKPNMHYLHQGFYIPTLYSEALGAIGMAHDESGSVSDEDVKLYLGAIYDIWNTLTPSELDIVAFTTHITREFKFHTGDDISDIKFRGNGGTSIFPVFEHFKDKQLEVLIIFTDMEFRYPTEVPPYPVIWINTGSNKATAPFGHIIHIN